MAKFSQDDRPLAVETNLGKDKLVLTSFSGTEQMSRLFTFDLQMLSNDGGIVPKEVLGQAWTFSVVRENGERRHFHGHVARFSYSGKSDRAHMYRAEVVPWLWFLTRTSDCRIFQEMTAPDIIKQVFADLGFSDYEMSLSGSHPTRNYCVQYRESDFNFVSRLMEEEGIFYYFKHEQGKHTLVVGDKPSNYMDIADSNIQLLSNLSQPEITDHLYSWNHGYEYRSGKWAHTDYDFEDPDTSLMCTANSVVSLTNNSKYEFYDYPGVYRKKGDGENLIKLRIEEEEVGHEVVEGSSWCRTFSPGGKFELAKHHVEAEAGKQYVLIGVQHQANLGGSYISGVSHADTIYTNTFTCIPATLPYRPPRVTGKPTIVGFQTAVVVGPAGEEIYTDKYGRVKCQFHWDREGRKDENTSCWMRVATPWAGQNWGMIHIPRIGQEVVVAFEEGDPDRPLIMGMVYNSKNMPPWTLPDNMTQSGIMTRSTKQGSTDHANIIRFEDKKDSEEILIHAEKDFNCIVENNETRKVGFEDKDKGDQDIEIFNNQTLKVGTPQCADGSQTITIYKNRDVTIETGNDGLTIKQGNRTTTLNSGNMTTRLKMGNMETTLDMGNRTTTIKMGNDTTKLDLGKSETEAMQSIELKVGQSSIKVDQTGVTISGMMIKIEGTVQTEVKGLMTQVKGDAMLMAKGGITMIN